MASDDDPNISDLLGDDGTQPAPDLDEFETRYRQSPWNEDEEEALDD